MNTRLIPATLLALFLPALLAAQSLADADTGKTRLLDPQPVDGPADELQSHVVKRGASASSVPSEGKIGWSWAVGVNELVV